MSKHDWNDYQNYIDVHDRVLRFFSCYMTPVKTYSSEWPFADKLYLILELNNVQFTTARGTVAGLVIEKHVIIRRAPYPKPQAKTWSYKYHAYDSTTGIGLLRYCSPDRDAGNPGNHGGTNHHAVHHRHDFSRYGCDPIAGDVTPVDSEKVPHVGDFLNELLMSY
jgi:hypothetical protein